MKVTSSAECFASSRDEIKICYQTFGNPNDVAVLLIMGLSGPMNWWDEQLCQQIAANGYFVIRYDNRDIGKSSSAAGRISRSQIVKAFLQRPVSAPYQIRDLAADAIAVLDEIGISTAHLVGVSMGGMIAQTIAIDFPDRAASLVSIMSTTGNRRVGWQDPRLFPALLSPVQPGRAGYLTSVRKFWNLISSPRFPMTTEYQLAKANETYDRGTNPAGVMRQMLAVLTQPDRTKQLRQLQLPATIIHGTADRLVHVSGGKATARAIPNAELLLIPGMGHDLPPQLFPMFSQVISATASRVSRQPGLPTTSS